MRPTDGGGVKAMAYATIEVTQDGPVSLLTLNRPGALNALNRAMVEELRDYFGRLPSDTVTRVVVLRGAGRAFCAGLDLKEGGGDIGTVQGGCGGSVRSASS